jgi:hypothetical protein
MDDHEYQEKWREEERKQIFRHQQQLGELWTDPEKEKYNDKVFLTGIGVGMIAFGVSAIAGNVILGICLFILSLVCASGFTK